MPVAAKISVHPRKSVSDNGLAACFRVGQKPVILRILVDGQSGLMYDSYATIEVASVVGSDLRQEIRTG